MCISNKSCQNSSRTLIFSVILLNISPCFSLLLCQFRKHLYSSDFQRISSLRFESKYSGDISKILSVIFSGIIRGFQSEYPKKNIDRFLTQFLMIFLYIFERLFIESANVFPVKLLGTIFERIQREIFNRNFNGTSRYNICRSSMNFCRHSEEKL